MKVVLRYIEGIIIAIKRRPTTWRDQIKILQNTLSIPVLRQKEKSIIYSLQC